MSLAREWPRVQTQPAKSAAIYWGAGAVGVIALIAILLGQPLVAVAALLVLPTAIAAIHYPHFITPVVIFIIYSNAAVVAIRFHHVPAIASVLLAFALLIPLGWHLWSGRRQLVLTSTLPLIVLFVLIQACGVAAARDHQAAIIAVQSSVMEGLLLYLLVTNVVRTRTDAVLSVCSLLLAGSFMGGLSLYQQVTGTFNKTYGGFAQVSASEFRAAEGDSSARQSRLSGPIGEQNRYAQVMLMLVPLGLCQVWGAQDACRKALAAAATALCAIGCALAFSRGAAVGFVLMLVLMTVMRQLQVRQLALIGMGLLVLILAIPQYATRLASLANLSNLVSGPSTGEKIDGAMRGRATVMLAALRVAIDYPLLGVGPNMFNDYAREYGNEGGLRALDGPRAAHSLYLEVAAEHGFTGLACFLALVAVSLTNLVRMKRWWHGRDRRMEYMATGYILALACYLTTGLFLQLSYARYFWLVLALADATSNVGRITAEQWLAAQNGRRRVRTMVQAK